MFGLKSMSGVRDLARGGNWIYRLTNATTRKSPPESFTMEAVLADACKAAGVAVPAEPEKEIPDYRWWKKLCRACGDKVTTNYGGHLLRDRLTNALTQRLAVEEAYRLNGSEIDQEAIVQPIIVMGIPRSNGHMAAHVLARSGLFLTPRQCDTLSPSLMLEVDRRDRFLKQFRGFGRINPDFLCVRVPACDQIDDDLTLHLMTPQSYAWGLLHGLDDYLLECIEEDQTAVYAQVRRTLQLFQWYKRCGHFSEAVVREQNPLGNPIETQTYGTKNPLLRPQWLLYSPFAVLSSDALHSVFPDLRAIWVHRALAQCIPSLCSSLSLHNSLYTGKPPTESQLASVGEKVLGIFGSGTDYAIEFYGNFDQRRMAHWSNRDVKRHASRVAGKTLAYFGMELDRYRRLQMIDGQTEYLEAFRPLHDAQMPYFALHEGILGDVFHSYTYQFEEFAYEKRLGVVVKEYQPLAGAADQISLGTMKLGSSEGPKDGHSSFTTNQPMSGHFLQEGKGFR